MPLKPKVNKYMMLKLFSKIGLILTLFLLFLAAIPAKASDGYYFICTNEGWFVSDISLCKDITADEYNIMSVDSLIEKYSFNCETGSKGQGSCNQIIGLVSSTGERISLDNPMKSNSIPDLIGVVIKNLLSVLGAISLLMFIIGAFKWITSAGNQEKVKSGTNTMAYAALGIILVFASYMLVKLVISALRGTLT